MFECCRETIDESEEYITIFRNQLLAAIFAAEIRGFEATKEALIELLREVEELRTVSTEA